MCPLKAIPHNHFIGVSNHVLNPILKIWKSSAGLPNDLLILFWPSEFAAIWIMTDKIGIKNLTHHAEISLMPYFVPDSLGKQHITFRGCHSAGFHLDFPSQEVRMAFNL